MVNDNNSQAITFIELFLLLIFIFVCFTQPFWNGNTFAEMFNTTRMWNGEITMKWGRLWYLKISPIFIAFWGLSSIFSINSNRFNFNFLLLKAIGLGYFIIAISFYPGSHKEGVVYLLWISIFEMILILTEAVKNRKNIYTLLSNAKHTKE